MPTIAEETKRDSGNNVIYSLGYGYDAVGNRTTRTLGGTTSYWTYDDHNKLTKIGSTPGGNDLATFGYDSNGNMTSVSGSLFGSKTMVYNDDNRMTSITYGGVTDLYYYTYEGLRYRARLNGTYYRYLYDGERVLEELNDSGTMTARYTTENGSYYGQWLHLYRPSGSLSRFPMYDNIGTARGLLDASGTATDWYELDTFGRQVSSSGTTPNPYRYGGAWGYISDPSGMLQLGERFYYPELGRFVSQDLARDGTNWYGYGEGNPVVSVDPEGLFLVPIFPDPYEPPGPEGCMGKYMKDKKRCEDNLEADRCPLDPQGPFWAGLAGAVGGGWRAGGDMSSRCCGAAAGAAAALAGYLGWGKVRDAVAILKYKACMSKAAWDYNRCKGGGGSPPPYA